MNCPACNALIADQSKECPVCFAQVRPPEPAAASAAAPNPALDRTTAMDPADLPTPPWTQTNRTQAMPPPAAPPPQQPPAHMQSYMLSGARELSKTRTRRNRAPAVILGITLVCTITAVCIWIAMHPPVYPLSDHLRTYKVGDSWTYHLSIERHSPLGDDKGMVGSITYTIEQDQIDGQPALVEVAKSKTPSVNKLFRHRTFFVQESGSGTCFKLGEKRAPTDDVQRLNPPAFYCPGTWEANTVYTTREQFEDTPETEVTHRVVGTEVINTQIGRFTAWKVESSGYLPQGVMSGSIRVTTWWAPQLGQPVKDTISIDAGKINAKITQEIAATSVPLVTP